MTAVVVYGNEVGLAAVVCGVVIAVIAGGALEHRLQRSYCVKGLGGMVSYPVGPGEVLALFIGPRSGFRLAVAFC